MEPWEGSDYPISEERLEQLFIRELQAFRRDFGQAPARIQHWRAGAVAWIAVAAPEVLSTRTRDLLLEATWPAGRKVDDYAYHGWFLSPYIDAALYALTADPTKLSDLIINLDNGAADRRSLCGALALVAPRLAFGNNGLLSVIESNLSKRHFFNQILLRICVAMRGTADEKLKQLRVWRHHTALPPHDRSSIDALIDGGCISNHAIFEELTCIQQYILMRLLEPSAATTCEIEAGSSRKSLLVSQLWERLVRHPLNQSEVCLDSDWGD